MAKDMATFTRPDSTTIDSEVGCWIAGHEGQYATDTLATIYSVLMDDDSYNIDIQALRWLDAVWSGQTMPDNLLTHWEVFHEYGDEMVDKLNEAIDSEHYLTWQDGELFCVNALDESVPMEWCDKQVFSTVINEKFPNYRYVFFTMDSYRVEVISYRLSGTIHPPVINHFNTQGFTNHDDFVESCRLYLANYNSPS